MVPTRAVLMALLAIALAGCPGGGPTTPVIVSFTCSPTTLTFPGSPVTLSWNVDGAISLSIDQGVGPVTPPNSGSRSVNVAASTTFTLTATGTTGSSSRACSVLVEGPGPHIVSFTATPNILLPAGGVVTLAWNVTGATELRVYPDGGLLLPPDAGTTTVGVTASTDFVLVAANAVGQNTLDASVTVPSGETITGAVVDSNGQPVAGTTVLISAGAFSGSTQTDADGGFTVPYVPISGYTATVIDPSHAVQYQGLSRLDPVLTDIQVVNPNRSARISGQFDGGIYPQPSNYVTDFLFSAPPTSPQTLGDQPTGSYSPTIQWLGPASTTGTLYALQVHTDAGLPVDYPGYGTLSNVSVQDMGVYTGQNIGLAPVTPGAVSGTLGPPSGYNVLLQTMSLLVAPSVNMRIVFQPTPSASFAFNTPAIPGTSLTVGAYARSAIRELAYAQKANLPPNDFGFVINIPASPTILTPAASATGVTLATPFSWTPYPNGVYLLAINSQSAAASFYVVTASRSATIPDLADAGLPLPPSAQYYWQVIGYGPLNTVNAFAGPGGLSQLNFVDYTEGQSALQTFTTGP